MIGEIKLFAFDGYHVHGYVTCDGRELQISSYPALFSLIGSKYGGDGRTTFRVPRIASPWQGTVYAIGAVDEDYPEIET